jgi:surfeit locus 1 family protein
MPEVGRRFRFNPEWRISLFVLVMVPLMAGLGFWQLARAQEKAALAAAFEARQLQSPSSLADLVDRSPAALSYLPVTVTGTFQPGEYFLLDNRIQGGKFGYEVLAVLEIASSAERVLINRGWLPGDAARLQWPDVPELAGSITLQGHVYVAPGRPYLLADTPLESGWPKRIQAVEVDKLSRVFTDQGMTLFPYPIRIDQGQPGSLSVDWQVINVSPQKHQGYAVQWFAMAAVLFIFYVLRSSNLWQLLTGSNRL